MTSAAAEADIRRLIARYCDAVNRHDGGAWANTWATDGRWLFLGQEHVGRDDILAFWQSVMAQLDYAIMLANSALLEIAGATASGRWYTHEILRTRGEGGRVIVGIYDDTYSRIGGSWLIQSRRYHKLYEAPTDEQEQHWAYPVPQEDT
jgi:ketosteroid isomerase-like protein